jgi:pseudouridine synthase
MRLNRYLALCAVAARRKADELIAQGRVTVNGSLAPPGGLLVVPGRDLVEVDGRQVLPPLEYRYFAVNKPVGYLSAVSDRSRRPVVVALVPDALRPGLAPVGRLDLDSHGLLLLTDDGVLSHRLQHPRHHVEREYEVTVRGPVDQATLRRLRGGVVLEEGRTGPAQVEVIEAGQAQARLRVVIRQGWKRQLRRSLAAVGHPVIDLLRVRIGSLRLGGLAPGSYRALTEAELEELRHNAGL